jgi:hypothetical protein
VSAIKVAMVPRLVGVNDSFLKTKLAILSLLVAQVNLEHLNKYYFFLSQYILALEFGETLCPTKATEIMSLSLFYSV